MRILWLRRRPPKFEYRPGFEFIPHEREIGREETFFRKADHAHLRCYSEVKEQTLDVILTHEFAHTSLFRDVFDVTAVPRTIEDEIETVERGRESLRGFLWVSGSTGLSAGPVSV